ncbi:hypothetical protein CRUP_009112 [Coryphaenoides rupestris]|nr:hypothetical protein CRUP_009112 [Coryphaenoides rupestris]
MINQESYKAQRHIVAETIAETERVAASLAGGVPELDVNREHLKRVQRLGARIRRESQDMEAVWESIQREIERANHIVWMLEAVKKEL